MWEVEAVSVVIYVGQVVLAEYQTTKQSKSSLLYTIQAWCMHRMKLKFVYTKLWKRVVTLFVHQHYLLYLFFVVNKLTAFTLYGKAFLLNMSRPTLNLCLNI